MLPLELALDSSGATPLVGECTGVKVGVEADSPTHPPPPVCSGELGGELGNGLLLALLSLVEPEEPTGMRSEGW